MERRSFVIGWLRAASARRSAAVLLASVVLLTGCATKRDLRDLRGEMRAQSARQDSIFQRLFEELDQIGDTLRSEADYSFEFRGHVQRELLDIKDQLIQVQEMSGVNQRTLTQLRDQVEAGRARLDEYDSSRGPSSAGSSEEADAAFDAAYSAYQRRSSTAARMGFEQFIQQYPTHQRVPEARYYLSDQLAQDGDVEEAIAGFLRIPELFPADPLAADALYRVGVLELDRGNADAARRYFQRVVTGYPDSDAARVARERLSEIG
ncbi:MAG: tetratricopeptide repeat protein [Gemmatimonadota bacterium]